jgi:hypothetical protein
MTIRVVRNANGNCIQFVGSSQPAYWNSCLSGAVNETDSTRVDVINDIRTTNSDNPFFEFFGIPYTEFRDKDGGSFTDAAEAAAYITAQANVTGSGVIEFGATDTLDVSRDATNTNILFSTGDSYGVHAIKALAQADGNITIRENTVNGVSIYEDIRPANVTVGGVAPTSATVTAVVNTLNALFEVTPLGLGGVDPTTSYSTVTNSGLNININGDITYNAGVATKGPNTGEPYDDFVSTSLYYITQAGEYIEMDWSAAPNGTTDYGSDFVMGFFSDVVSATPTSEYEGMDMGMRLRGLDTFSSHNYGLVIENGYYNNPHTHQKFRMGLDSDRRLYISFYDAVAEEWQVAVRSAFPTGDETYGVVFFLKEEGAEFKWNGLAAEEIDPASFNVQYRYIESPDGEFYYPLFATADEANWVDQLDGGSGASHSHMFADEVPSQNQWFMPETGGTHAGTSAPANTDTVTYTEILTGADAGYTPTAYTDQTLTVDEGDTVNLAIDPAGANWTTTISGQPAGFTLSNGNLVGTAPEVSGIIADNASDEYVITVTRSNVFGTSTGTLTLTVNNLTQTVTAISGFTHVPETIAMVDSDTLEAGSVVTIDNSLEQGKRMVFSAAFIRGLFDDISNSGSGHSVLIGVLKTGLYGSQWTNHSSQNIQMGWRLHKESGNKYLSVIYNGDGISSTNFGVPSFTRDLVMFHDTASNKLHMTHHGVTGGTGETMDTPTVISNLHMTPGSSDVDITIGLSIGSSTDVDITTTGITEVDNPSLGATAWTKAVDFSGSSEVMEVGGSEAYSSPLKMYQSDGVVAPNANAALTVPSLGGHTTNPWSTACVFKPGGQGFHQGTLGGTIWGVINSYSHYHNIRLVEKDGHIWFKWGYKNSENEIRIIENASTSTWYGVYVGFRGQKSATPSAAFLGQAFDIHVMSNADGWNSAGSDISTAAEWALSHNTTGRSMTQGMSATKFKMGNAFGTTGHYEFNGKIASCVVTTQMGASLLPDATEIKAMITDPKTWLADLDGTTRRSYYGPNFTFNSGGSDISSALSTQVYLMGDGDNDSYSNNIRNQSNPTDTNYSDLEFNNMVASDIETVNIPGLS